MFHFCTIVGIAFGTMMIMGTHDLVAYENPDMMSLQVLFEYLYNEGVKVPRPHHVKVK